MLYGAELYWLPLGAGGQSVRLKGRAYEALVAALQRRSRCDLYHSALVVYVPPGRFVIEQTRSRTGEAASAASSAKARSAAAWYSAYGSSATRFDAGRTASSRTSTRPSKVPAA